MISDVEYRGWMLMLVLITTGLVYCWHSLAYSWMVAMMYCSNVGMVCMLLTALVKWSE